MILLEIIGLALLFTLWQAISSDDIKFESSAFILKVALTSLIVFGSILLFVDILDFILEITG